MGASKGQDKQNLGLDLRKVSKKRHVVTPLGDEATYLLVRPLQSRRADFNCNGKTHFVSYFDDEIEAARAYDAAILPLSAEFAG